MGRWIGWRLVLGIVGGVLLVVHGDAVGAADTPGPASARIVTATDRVPVPLSGAFAAFLAPGGARIAWTDKKQICVTDAAGGEARCVTGPVSIDADSLRWSPDGTRLVFTEDFFRYLNEPDIWTLDARDGTLTDLTDDGIAKIDVSKGLDTGSIDTVPCWSADGTQILFLRGRADGPAIVEDTYIVAATGGAPTRMGALSADGFSPITLDWSPDGTRIAYNVGLGVSDPAYGIWTANVDGTDARRVFNPQSPITNVAFSPDGQSIAAIGITDRGGVPGGEQSATIIRLSDGTILPVDPGQHARVSAWAPAGSGIAYLVNDPRDPDRAGLYLADQPGTAGAMVAPGPFAPPSVRGAPWRTFAWAANDTILLLQGTDTVVLLHLRTM